MLPLLSSAVSCAVPKTRFERFYNCIRPTRLMFGVCYVTFTGAVTWCAAQLIGGRFKSLSYPCPSSNKYAIAKSISSIFLTLKKT